MAQIHGSGLSNFSNTAMVDDSIARGQGRLFVNSLDNTEAQIHKGHHFFIDGFDVLASSGDTIYFGVTAPAGSPEIHMRFIIDGTTRLDVNTYEGAQISGGVPTTPINNNRNSSVSSALTVVKNPAVVGTSGTIIQSASVGATKKDKFSASIGREGEVILRSGTTYLYEMKAGADNNVVNYLGMWYEV